MQKEEKKSTDEVERDLEASRIRFDRLSREKDVDPKQYVPAPPLSANQDTLNIALFGE